jgi:phage terminase large subunit
MTDKDGKVINEPSPIWNHCMDAIRYGMESIKPQLNDDVNLPDDTKMFNQGYY